MSASEALAAALRLLTVRNRSEQELRRRLRQKGFAEAAIDEVLQRCRRWGYLDDDRFARERARLLVASGRAVGPRLLADLRSRGIPEELARDALEEALAETSEGALLAELFERRFPAFDPDRANERERRRVVNFFLRRGFSLAAVLAHLQERD